MRECVEGVGYVSELESRRRLVECMVALREDVNVPPHAVGLGQGLLVVAIDLGECDEVRSGQLAG